MKGLLRVLCDMKGGFEGCARYERRFWEFYAILKEVLRVLCDMKGFENFVRYERRF
jgi:hypothetical protein